VHAPSVRSGPLRGAAALLGIQALAATAFAVLVLGQLAGPRPGQAAGGGLLLLGYAAILLVTAGGVLRGRRWARGPAVATQLLHLLMAWSFRTGSAAGLALGVAGGAVVVLVCLLLPTSTARFAGPRSGE